MNVEFLLQQKHNALYSIRPEATIGDCIGMLNDKRIGALVVVNDRDEIEGIVSERDILRSAYARQCQICDMPVRDVMTPKGKLITATREDTIDVLMERMTTHRIRHIPVMDAGKVVAMISIGDVVKSLFDEAISENKQMKDYIAGRYI